MLCCCALLLLLLVCAVHSARGLSNKELVGKMDPFTVVTISGSKDEKFKTSTNATPTPTSTRTRPSISMM